MSECLGLEIHPPCPLPQLHSPRNQGVGSGEYPLMRIAIPSDYFSYRVTWSRSPCWWERGGRPL